jgi:hypothetical protein
MTDRESQLKAVHLRRILLEAILASGNYQWSGD